MKKILKKVFKLLELQKNDDKEYLKPQGYESVRLKIEHIAKRATKKEDDKTKGRSESRSGSEESRSDGSDNESVEEEDPELEDDKVVLDHQDG
jgi:hypothetical protein